MFLFGQRRFTRSGPLGLALTGYALWRRLSPERQAAITDRARIVAGEIQRRVSSRQPRTFQHAAVLPTQNDVALSVAATTGAATAPTEEIALSDLTSPGTVPDPDIEEQRAEQALLRERESRQTEVTKFEEQRLKLEAERAAGASPLGEVPPSTAS
jgi:hypothetical protein